MVTNGSQNASETTCNVLYEGCNGDGVARSVGETRAVTRNERMLTGLAKEHKRRIRNRNRGGL